jgi:hypothetical protein
LQTILGVIVAACLLNIGCTQQQVARQYGGTATIDLPAGKKLVTATWKESHFWYLVRNAKAGETPETYEFKESSTFGIMQGTMVLRER